VSGQKKRYCVLIGDPSSDFPIDDKEQGFPFEFQLQFAVDNVFLWGMIDVRLLEEF
jgi:hypothetical protein